MDSRKHVINIVQQQQKQSQDLTYIDNKKIRQAKLGNAIEDIRKQVCFLILMRIAIF